jgi:hypothetical protein
MSPLILLSRKKKQILNIDEIPLTMFGIFYFSSIVLFAVSLRKRVWFWSEIEIKQLEIWSSCFGYFVSLITNTIVFSLLIKSFLKFKAKNQKIIPGIIGIIILPFIIISIVIVRPIVQTKEKAMEKRENTCHMILICTLTIIVSLSPIFNFSRAHKLHKIEIIPEYTIICAVFNYLLWTCWMFYLYYNNVLLLNDIAQDAARRYLIYGIVNFIAFLIYLIMLFVYCYFKNNQNFKKKNNVSISNSIQSPLIETDTELPPDDTIN